MRASDFRRLRGAVGDESAFWPSTDRSANPDSEIINSVRPGLASTSGMLILASSPYARRGELWRMFNRYFGKTDDAAILVAKAPTKTMNAALPAAVIERAYERDAAAAAAEYGAEFRRDIETLVSPDTPIYTSACLRCGISTKSLWRYIRASQREDDPANFKFDWCDLVDWFHHHLKQAMRMSALMIEATARHHALHGFDEVQVFQGKICWKEDPKLAALDDRTLEKLGHRDRYERNPDGSLIPLTVRRKPSDQLVLKMLTAHFPRAYGDKVENQHAGIIGVMHIGRDGKMRPASQMPAVEDQSDELVVGADCGVVEPTQMKIGLVVAEPPRDSEEFDRMSRDFKRSPIGPLEFREPVEADGTVAVASPAVQEPVARAAPEQHRELVRRRPVTSQPNAPVQPFKTNEPTRDGRDLPAHLSPRPSQSHRDHIGPGEVLPGGMKVC